VRAVSCRFSPTALLLLAALALAGCGGDDPSPSPDAGGADAGAACQTDDDCPLDRFCADATRTCEPGSEDACTEDSTCGDGRRCEIVDDCGRTRCRNRCVPKACAANSECGAWVCVAGQCAEPVSCATAPCPEGLVCNPTTKACEPAGGTACTTDMDCAGNGVCYRGECGAELACASSTDCPSDLRCIGDLCRDPCTQASDCPGNMVQVTCDVPSGECLSRCLGDDTCEPDQICEDNICRPAECDADADCNLAAMEVCVGAELGRGRCEVQAACQDRSGCARAEDCVGGRCVPLPACRQDRECVGAAYCEDRVCQPAAACAQGPCAEGFACIAARCVPAPCRGDDACPSGEVCVSGACGAPTSPAQVTAVQILSPAAVLRPSERYRFRAIALDGAGRIVPGVAIAWSSSAPGIASIDARGVSTAQGVSGTAAISAAVSTGSMTVSSATVGVTVLELAADTFRVHVRSGRDGEPVVGATVRCDAESAVTNGNGFADFAPAAARTCTAFAADHDWVTVVGLAGPSVVLRLPPLSRRDRITGYTGAVDTSGLPGDQPVRLSISGGAHKGGLSTLTPLGLFGGDLFTFEIPLAGEVSLPSAVTAAAAFAGQDIDLKGTFHARAAAGLQRSWTFGGRAELGDLGLRSGNLLGNVLPILQTFRHGTRGELDRLVGLPRVVDAQDFDGDGDTTEEVPDWASFRPAAMTPAATQRLRFAVQAGATGLPATANAFLVVGGALMPEIGFVPLGMDGIFGTGVAIGDFTTALAPAYDGLEAGEYAVLLAAAQLGAGGLPEAMTARQAVAPTLPDAVDLSGGFLDFPTGTVAEAERRVGATAPRGADAWRMRLVSDAGAWHVWVPAGTAELVLPAPPEGATDRLAGASALLEALDLESGATLDGLFAPGLDALHADRVTRRFSQQVVR
jgi:hypothetical protein